MEIILREPIENLGGRGDVVQVANGYARNYLLPRKLALPVTPRPTGVRWNASGWPPRPARRSSARTRTSVKPPASTPPSASSPGASGARERSTGRSRRPDIADCLAGQQLVVDKRRIVLTEPIKELGDFVVPVKLHRDVAADLKVTVVREGGDDTATAAAEPESETPSGSE